MSNGPPASQSRSARRWREADGLPEDIARDVPDEVPVGIAYDSAPYVVVMASPGDIEDLAVGFTLTEQVAPFGAIQRVSLSEAPEGLIADVLLDPAAGESLVRARRRTLESRSSCGLCGVETLREAMRPIRRVGDGPRVTHRALQRALAELEASQPLGALTRATHAAALADANGAVRRVREDVGRHNALDKLIGAALRAGMDPAAGMVIITSRCSYEMVDKAAAAGVTILAAISAPTALAIDRAREAGITLVALARADGHTVFCGEQRLGEA